jgi:hypothetical protein
MIRFAVQSVVVIMTCIFGVLFVRNFDVRLEADISIESLVHMTIFDVTESVLLNEEWKKPKYSQCCWW